jgi:hypothetical protein
VRSSALAHVGEVVGHDADAGVQLLAEGADLLRFARDGLLPPAVGDGAEQRNERGRRGEHDALLDGALDERRVRSSAAL